MTIPLQSFQGGTGPYQPTDTAPGVPPKSTGANTGICSLTFQGRVFRFRTNPNEIWWSYELIRAVEDTYGGRVIQLLGTRLGDLKVKVEIGRGGWPYLMQVMLYLRDMLSDQRLGNTAEFIYTTRNWHLNVYAMTIPFEDRMEATVREIELNFKIQEDVSGTLSRVSLDAELLRLQNGVYGPGQMVHNKYNDYQATTGGGLLDPTGPGGPTYSPSNIMNTVAANPLGQNPGGLNPSSTIPFMPTIPGINLLG